MEYDQLLKVHNHGTERVKFRYNSQTHLVPPGGDAYVPFEAVVLKLGDPRSGPTESAVALEGGRTLRIPSRVRELRRLSTKTGIYDITPAKIPDIKAALPDVTVTNMDSDEPIVFPVDDPDCIQYTPVDVDKSQMAIMQRQLDKMRRQQVVLEQQLKQSKVNADTSIPAAEVEEDVPTPVRVPRNS